MSLPSDNLTGKRVAVRDNIGTIRYHGPIEGTSGSWLGIEWDDPLRGKHDGSKDGVRYFSCRHPTSGSFLRLSANVNFGQPFLKALLSKYVESQHGSQQETVLLGSSNGAIQVEAVNLDKIRAKFSNLARLKEVSLDGEAVSSAGPDPCEIRKTCPNVRGLDLSKNLLADWQVIGAITANLPALQRLSLNQNRLAPPTSDATLASMAAGFRNLEEVQLNSTMIDWPQMQHVTSFMPHLKSVELAYNSLFVLADIPRDATISLAPLRSCNLSGNLLIDWPDVLHQLRQYTLLERFVLASNGLSSIPKWTDGSVILRQLKHLSLSSNNLGDWADVDNLSVWCPELESLALVDNPITSGHELARNSRSFIIAKIPSLLALNGTAISLQERTDSELYYLSYLSQSGVRPEELVLNHPQWPRLCTKHGFAQDRSRTNADDTVQSQTTLGSNLFTLTIHVAGPGSDSALTTFRAEDYRVTRDIRVLPSMTLKAFRLKIIKIVKQAGVQGMLRGVWLRMSDNALVELDQSRDSQDLSWLGLDSSSDVVVTVT